MSLDTGGQIVVGYATDPKNETNRYIAEAVVFPFTVADLNSDQSRAVNNCLSNIGKVLASIRESTYCPEESRSTTINKYGYISLRVS